MNNPYTGPTARLDFAAIARALMLGGGGWAEAEVVATNLRATDKVLRIIKSAVTAGDMNPSWAATLSELVDASDAFTFDLRSRSFFDAIRASGASKIVPPRMQTPATIGSAIGGTSTNGSLKSISALTISPSNMEMINCVAIVYATNELLRKMKLALLHAELSRAAAASVDTQFLSFLTADTSVVSVATTGSPQGDLAAALEAMNLNSASKVYCVAKPNTAAAIATWPGASGGDALAFPGLTIQGGDWQGVELFATDSLPTNSPGDLLFVDVSKIATAAELMLLNAAEHAMIFEGNGDSSDPGISLWQRGMVGVRAERQVGWSVAAGSNSIVTVTGVAY